MSFSRNGYVIIDIGETTASHALHHHSVAIKRIRPKKKKKKRQSRHCYLIDHRSANTNLESSGLRLTIATEFPLTLGHRYRIKFYLWVNHKIYNQMILNSVRKWANLVASTSNGVNTGDAKCFFFLLNILFIVNKRWVVIFLVSI